MAGTLDVPGYAGTGASGINNRGQIVGFYSSDHGFLLDHGSFTAIDVPGAIGTVPSGINERGQIEPIHEVTYIDVLVIKQQDRWLRVRDRELLVKLLSQITRTLSTLELEASAEIHKWPLKEALSLVDQATD